MCLMADGSYLKKLVLMDNFHLYEKAVANSSGKKTIVDKSYKVGAICRARVFGRTGISVFIDVCEVCP